jgi:hypothetical protein
MGTKITELATASNVASTTDYMLVSKYNGSTYDSQKTTKEGIFSGWKDLLGDINVRGGPTSPTYTQIGATNYYAYDFVGATLVKSVFCNFHLDHSYKTGTDIYCHMHWMPADTGAGNVKWFFDVAYASGYDRGTFGLASPTTVNVITAAPAVAYRHMISEVVFSNAGGTGGLLANTLFETDGIIMIRAYRDPTDGSDTYTGSAYGLYCDLHFQADKPSTPNRNYPFA